MFPRADWFQPVDTLILIFMAGHRFRMVVPPIVVSVNIGISSPHANRRMRILEDAGMIEKPDPPGKDGYYRITNLGERAALGQIDHEELESLNPEE